MIVAAIAIVYRYYYLQFVKCLLSMDVHVEKEKPPLSSRTAGAEQLTNLITIISINFGPCALHSAMVFVPL